MRTLIALLLAGSVAAADEYYVSAARGSDRAVAESAVEPVDAWANQVRRMLGLPLEGTDLKETSDVWLHRLATDAGLKSGEKRYKDKYGCGKPEKPAVR